MAANNNTNNNMPKQILIIDDDSSVSQSLETSLANYGVTVVGSQDLESAMFHFKNQSFEVVLVELEFAQLHGLALIQKFRENEDAEKRGSAFILMSGKVRSLSDDNLLKELLDIQVIVKPFSLIQILPFLSRGLATREKLVKYESFREKILLLARQNEYLQAFEAVKKNLVNLGQRGIQLACEVFEVAKKYEEGLSFISPIAEKERQVILYQYLKGRFLKLLGRNEEARVFLEETYKSSQHHIKRLQTLGELYVNVGEPDKAVVVMKEFLDLNPENQDVKFPLFKELEDKGFDAEAKKFCRDTTQPMEIIRYYNNRGVEASKRGDIAAAIAEYKCALQYFPSFKENYRIYYNIALSEMKLKTPQAYADAMTNLTKCLELNPNFDKAKKTLETLSKTLETKAS